MTRRAVECNPSRRHRQTSQRGGDGTDIKDITPEQIKRIKGCGTADELSQIAREEGVELSEDQLDALCGGDDDDCEWFHDSDDCISNT